ncbi:hypothetical protein [Pseudomonas sp.]|uniref:hypothetical protein n=1 Tax=Pseudomonas sp. TaxID=306 RepID=UPI002ED9E906
MSRDLARSGSDSSIRGLPDIPQCMVSVPVFPAESRDTPRSYHHRVALCVSRATDALYPSFTDA